MTDEKHRLWARIAFNLTICARLTYVPGTDDVADPPKLRAYNEMLHRVTSWLYSGEDDSWLYTFLLERAKWSGVLGCVKWAIEEAQKTVRAV